MSTLGAIRHAALAPLVVALVIGVLSGTAKGEALVAIDGSFGSTPVYTTAPPDDPRLFVVERGGAIRVVSGGVLEPRPFLVIPNVDTAGERGLSSIAFAPDYASSGLFYVFVTPVSTDGHFELLEYRRSASDPDLADPTSKRLVILQHRPRGDEHYAGQLMFGPDGYLYVTVGDGQATDGSGHVISSQDTNTLLGKILRIDPRLQGDGAAYGIPAANPFAADPRCGPDEGTAPCPEIYAYGFRNPFRASFDGPTGDLVVGDVGEHTWEEVDLVRMGGNYGWGVCEGNHNTGTESVGCTDLPTQIPPIFEYHHDGANCAVIGGYVIRDPTLPHLDGRYLYGDHCASALRTLDLSAPGGDPRPTGLAAFSTVTLDSFGTDARGCFYALADNTVYRITATAEAPFACGRPLATSATSAGAESNAVTGPPSSPSTGPSVNNATPVDTDDVTPPRLRLTAHHVERIGQTKQIRVGVTCDENCMLLASGTVRLRSATTARLRGTRKLTTAGHRVTLRLKLSTALVRHVQRALKRGDRVVARVKVTAHDSAGNASRRTLRIRLR